MCKCHNNGAMRCIPVDVLLKLPRGGWFVRFDQNIKTVPNFTTRTYDESWVDAIVWSWVDRQCMDIRTAAFELLTGEYMGEA